MFPLRDIPTADELRGHACEMSTVSPAAVGAWLLLLRVGSDVFARHDAFVSQHGHSQGRFVTLMLLHFEGCADGPATPSTLAERAGLSRAAMTGILDGLEAEGLVLRGPHACDRRMQVIALTDAGSEHVRSLLPGHFDDIRGSMAGLSEAELDQLLTLLDKLRSKLRAPLQRPPAAHLPASTDQAPPRTPQS